MCEKNEPKRIYYWDVVSDVEFIFGCGTRVCGAIGVRFYLKAREDPHFSEASVG